MSQIKTKYNLEYKQLDGYRVVDAVNIASYMPPVIIDGSGDGTVNIDISKSNFFILDLCSGTASQTTQTLNVNFTNSVENDIFYLLIIESYSKTTINLDVTQEVIFRDENIDFFEEQELGEKKERLLSFKHLKKIGGDSYYMCLTTPWFRSALLEIPIEFVVTYIDDPAEGAEVQIRAVGTTTYDTLETNERGECEFTKPRNFDYEYVVTYSGETDSGTILASETAIEEEFIDILIELE